MYGVYGLVTLVCIVKAVIYSGHLKSCVVVKQKLWFCASASLLLYIQFSALLNST